jgi:hypothetical protein
MATMSKQTLAGARRALGLGFALPIIGGAAAIVFGLILRDLGLNIDVWLWLVIFAILGVSLVLGTRSSNSAFRFGAETTKRIGATRGALNLNFILGIIWSAVVAVSSFSLGSQSMDFLRAYHQKKRIVSHTDGKPNYWYESYYTIKPVTFDWFVGHLLPSILMLLLVVAGTYLLITERCREPKPAEDK